MNSNGSITFDGGDSDYSESLGEHFSRPRMSGLWDDLNPSAGGLISWKETGNSIVVTFENVPQYSTSDSNTFQFECFFNGELRMSWYGIDVADELAIAGQKFQRVLASVSQLPRGSTPPGSHVGPATSHHADPTSRAHVATWQGSDPPGAGPQLEKAAARRETFWKKQQTRSRLQGGWHTQNGAPGAH